jgi:hypothetical protein
MLHIAQAPAHFLQQAVAARARLGHDATKRMAKKMNGEYSRS